MKKISFIVIASGNSTNLKTCLDSLANQSYANFEVILLKLSVAEAISQLLADYAQKDTRFKYVTETNTNINLAKNKGLEIATGDYLMFLEENDFLRSKALEETLYITATTKADIVTFEWLEQCGDIITPISPSCKIMNSHRALLQDILKNNLDIKDWTTLYARSLWKGMKFDSHNVAASHHTKHEVFLKSSHIFYLPAALCVHASASTTKAKTQAHGNFSLLRSLKHALQAALLQTR